MSTGKDLTTHELNVLCGMASGLSNKGIGQQMFISEDTVKTHAQRLFRKLGARDRAHAVHLAHTGGLFAGTRIQPRVEDTVRLGAAHACLDKWRPERDIAPDESRFAQLYDGLTVCLAARPTA